MTAQQQQIPEGFRQDAKGRLVPEDQIKEIDKVRDELVLAIVDRATELRDQLRDFKADTFSEIQAFVETSAQEYDVQLGGRKGNVQLLSFDGQYKVVRAMQDLITFDERLQAAKALIDECLTEWVSDARPELVQIVQDAFRVDQAGKIRTGEVLGLRRRFNIQDKRWLKAMDAISDAVQVTGSKSYVRIYERDANGHYRPISLDIAGV
ncbi:DUF3164 family protein [Billgrantia gudaonensis]|uniref:Sulfate transporter n=1 Tax=Billgrantia gudaonensis TaxID=376427 RepID=A0A1G9AUR2_9GAMM|nr:DUF3164 family protein [Halomonas gudaonensis]SDK31011.1 Protein of unknown function [Halomonas gudaonensis]